MNLRILQQPLFMAAISGILLALAVPPLNLYFLAWFGLLPLMFSIQRSTSGCFREGFVAGFFFASGTIYWLGLNSGTIPVVAIASAVVAICVISFGWGLAAWAFKKILLRFGTIVWVAMPCSWVVWEGWLSYLGEVGFPWALLALTQAGFEPALQVMEFTGVWGTSFWVAGLNLLLFYLLISKQTRKKIVFGLIIFWLSIPYLSLKAADRYYRGDYETIRVLVAQGSVDPREKWLNGPEDSWQTYDSLSRAGSEFGIDLIVWPETALPVVLLNQSHYQRALSELAAELGASIVTGASARRKVNDRIHPSNVAYLVKPDSGIVDETAKLWLVPFGERVPFQNIFPALGNLNFGQAEFLPGLQQNLFEVFVGSTEVKFPVLICYESAFPDLTRKAVAKGANLLVNISNDAWYGFSSESYQINALSRFRCIETRRAMARASNTGSSVLIDPLGRVVAETEMFRTQWRASFLPLLQQETFFVRHGNWFLLVNTICYAGLLILAAVRKKLSGPESQPANQI